MKKSFKIIGLTLIAVILFAGGYITGSTDDRAVSKEIRVGHQNSENPEQIDYSHTFNNTENQSIINNFLMIYLNKEKVKDTDLDLEKPDIYVRITSPKQSTGLVDSRIWLTGAGAIIGQRNGESWDNIEFYSINEADERYIKEVIDYQDKENS